LLTDLEDRGLLDETLVVALGEMGRTPKPTPRWGRGHWSTLFPAVIAGAGVAPGTTWGSSDHHATQPVEGATSPEDLAATIYHALGIDPGYQLTAADGRPIPLVDRGEPVRGIFG
jgi:arylsulfatase A-like enzyme